MIQDIIPNYILWYLKFRCYWIMFNNKKKILTRLQQIVVISLIFLGSPLPISHFSLFTPPPHTFVLNIIPLWLHFPFFFPPFFLFQISISSHITLFTIVSPLLVSSFFYWHSFPLISFFLFAIHYYSLLHPLFLSYLSPWPSSFSFFSFPAVSSNTSYHTIMVNQIIIPLKLDCHFPFLPFKHLEKHVFLACNMWVFSKFFLALWWNFKKEKRGNFFWVQFGLPFASNWTHNQLVLAQFLE